MIDEILAGDRVVYSFFVIWITAVVVWLVLDWLGNPNRGRFRPKGTRINGTWRERYAAYRLKRAEEDAAIRSTLRDAYGASSLRLSWTKDHETAVLNADEQLVRPDPRARPEVEPRRLPRLLGFFRDDSHDNEPLLATYDPNPPVPASRGRWRLGGDPFMASNTGKPPSAATIRSRAWKNLSADEKWGADNQERMRAGKPPRRLNPNTDKIENAAIDLSTAEPFWRSDRVAASAPSKPS